MARTPDLISVAEAAARLSVSVRTVWTLVARYDLETVRLPGIRRTLIRADALAALLDQHTERPISFTARAIARSQRRRTA